MSICSIQQVFWCHLLRCLVTELSPVQRCEQCGAQMCTQTHWAGVCGEDHWDHCRENDRTAVRGGEELHAEGDPCAQCGEGPPVHQWVWCTANV